MHLLQHSDISLDLPMFDSFSRTVVNRASNGATVYPVIDQPCTMLQYRTIKSVDSRSTDAV